ncbi:hypothetical protein ETC01_14040 [Geobacillus sp. NFOSA3]|nr:hypothetical protein [Geobacillus sp. NFOSA3]
MLLGVGNQKHALLARAFPSAFPKRLAIWIERTIWTSMTATPIAYLLLEDKKRVLSIIVTGSIFEVQNKKMICKMTC